MQIHALNLYPVKALGGIALDTALLSAKGLAIPLGNELLYDRQWMLINEAGQMVTQRQVPKLVLLQPVITDGALYLTAAGFAPVRLSGNASESNVTEANATEAIASQVWKTAVEVQEHRSVSAWLAQVLPEARLKCVSLAAPRPVLLERFGPHSATHFADAAPYLIANTASLAALNQALLTEGETPVDERRFRANIWLSGIGAFAEHNLPSVQLPQGEIRLVDHCQRCSVITVDPERGVFCPNARPFKTLALLNAMPNQPKAPAFGVNAVFEQMQTVWISVGDTFV